MGRRILPPIIHELLLTELDTLDAYQAQLPWVAAKEFSDRLMPLMTNHERRAIELARLIRESGDVSVGVGHFAAPDDQQISHGDPSETLAAIYVLRDAEYACDIAWKAACSAVSLDVPQDLARFLETECRYERSDMARFEQVLSGVRTANRSHTSRGQEAFVS